MNTTEAMLYDYLQSLSISGDFTSTPLRKMVDGLASSFNGDVSSIPNEIEQLLPSDLAYHIKSQREREKQEQEEKRVREWTDNLFRPIIGPIIAVFGTIVILAIAVALIAAGPIGWVILGVLIYYAYIK